MGCSFRVDGEGGVVVVAAVVVAVDDCVVDALLLGLVLGLIMLLDEDGAGLEG